MRSQRAANQPHTSMKLYVRSMRCFSPRQHARRVHQADLLQQPVGAAGRLKLGQEAVAVLRQALRTNSGNSFRNMD